VLLTVAHGELDSGEPECGELVNLYLKSPRSDSKRGGTRVRDLDTECAVRMEVSWATNVNEGEKSGRGIRIKLT